MATKTGSKTASRKPAAHAAARKTTAADKPVAAGKSRVPKKELKRDVAPASAHATSAGKSRVISPKQSEPRSAPPPGHDVDSVALIASNKPRKNTEQGEPKARRAVLHPSTRTRD